MLQKLWPTPYKIKKGDLGSFLIQLIIFIIVCAVIGWVIGLVASLPIINIFGWILGLAVEVYSVVGIVLCLLNFLGVTK